MDKLLGYPKVDPHGSPIPDKNGKMVSEEYQKLSDCRQGDRVTFMAVAESSEDLLKFLNSRELSLGSLLEVISVEIFDESMSVTYGKRKEEIFSNKVCDKLYVQPFKG